MPHSDWKNDFAAALLDPAMPIPGGLVDPDGYPSAKRFAVYRNNVVRGLIDALREMYPVALRIVGVDFFEAMARAYVALDPPRSPILLEYGARFAHFIDGFEPVSSLPYLSDVCRIERAWLEAYHASEALPLDPSKLGAIQTSEILSLRLELHPSVRLIRSRFPALTIWRTNIHGSTPIRVDLEAGGEDVLIGRPYSEVEIRSISGAAFNFVQAIANQATILEAADIALDSDPEFSISEGLEALIRTDLVVNYRIGDHCLTNPKRGQDESHE